MSSAARSSYTIVRASPNTRRWNRWTNADAASRSPEASPATRVSSDTVHTAVLRNPGRQGLHGNHGSGAIPRTVRPVGPPGRPGRRLRTSEAVPEEAPLRARVGVVVVGDVAHVVVDVVLDGERLPGHPP